jgi:Lrp/AsnC family transcriptional regulator for asnA, asnC and gidA
MSTSTSRSSIRRASSNLTVAAPTVSRYDALDRRIIACLQRDGRMSNVAVARALGTTEATVRRRIRRLIETGTLRIVAVPSPEAAGFTISAIIGVSCDLSRVDEIAQRLATFSEVRYLVYSTGTFDLAMEAFFYSQEHLLKFLSTKLAATPGVTRTETAIVLKLAKLSFEWEIPMDGDRE